MKKHIHCFVSEASKVDGTTNVNINDMQNIANGSCDYVTFSELNTIPLNSIEPVLGGLSKKIKLGTGHLVIQFLNFDKVANDLTQGKLDINKINDLASARGSFFYENMITKILEQHNLKIENMIYQDYTISMNIIRS